MPVISSLPPCPPLVDVGGGDGHRRVVQRHIIYIGVTGSQFANVAILRVFRKLERGVVISVPHGEFHLHLRGALLRKNNQGRRHSVCIVRNRQGKSRGGCGACGFRFSGQGVEGACIHQAGQGIGDFVKRRNAVARLEVQYNAAHAVVETKLHVGIGRAAGGTGSAMCFKQNGRNRVKVILNLDNHKDFSSIDRGSDKPQNCLEFSTWGDCVRCREYKDFINTQNEYKYFIVGNESRHSNAFFDTIFDKLSSIDTPFDLYLTIDTDVYKESYTFYADGFLEYQCVYDSVRNL